MRKAIQFVCVLLVVAMLAVPVSAATASVTQQGAPTVVEATTTTKTTTTTKVETKTEEAAQTTTTDKGVEVTALTDLDKAPAEVKKVVEEAHEVLTSEKSLVKAVPAVATALKEMDVEVKAENLVVRDMFYLELDEKLAEGEEKVITFKAEGLKKGDFLMVMVYVDGEWVVLDADKVEITKKDTVEITFEFVGPIAFVTEK